MGLLNFEDAMNDPIMGMAQGLLAASGPSRIPVSLGQAMAAGMQGYQQAQDVRLNRQSKQMQLDAMKVSNDRKLAFEKMLPQMSPDVQQAYLMAGPDKAYEAMQSEQFMKQLGPLLGGGQSTAPAAPRPYQQNEGSLPVTGGPRGNFELGGQQQIDTLQNDLTGLQKSNPAEYQNVLKALQEQGVIPGQQVQPSQTDWGRVAAASAMGQLGGIKGAPGLMELAKFNKPDWQSVDAGGNIQFVNKNGGSMPTIQKTMSPDAMANNQLGWANYAKPTYHDGALVSPNGEIVKTPMYAPPKGSPEATAQSSAKMAPILDMADSLLNSATGSYLGTARDTAAQAVGVSTKGAQSAAQLKALEGAIMMAQPRMEGPQSDKDVALYRQMAAQIGDSTVPVETRRAALNGIRELHARYSLQDISQGAVPQSTKTPQAAPAPLSVQDGYIFLGGNPADPSRWKKQGSQ